MTARSGRIELDALDEIVLGQWLHAEYLGDRCWSVRVGGLLLTAKTRPDGTASVFVLEDDRPARERRKDARR